MEQEERYWRLEEHTNWYATGPKFYYGAVFGTGIEEYHICFDQLDNKAMAEQHVKLLNSVSQPRSAMAEYDHKLANLATRYYNMTQDRCTWRDWTAQDRDKWIKDFRQANRDRHAAEKTWSEAITTWCPL